ncbi:MAG: methanogenesis marker 16 metalloprotein [Methanobacteriaceae archaeon]|jgi:putative methanogenesis marker 16 metalloprotein|nr:methanogenesis marker 16 metalloprotein [Candidatus Methanorudis spinitermitis]
MKSKTIAEINEKIANEEANVFTSQELKELIREDNTPNFDEVDVVTCGTCGIMSGTAAIFHLDVFEPGLFKKAKNIYLNGVPGFVGPCPNEWLGSVDTIVYGTSHSVKDHSYGGGFLFKDIIDGKDIEIELESIDGEKYSSTITIENIPTAQMIGTRMAFKNYTSFVNPSKDPVSSIFNGIAMEGNFESFSFSGCGEINPLENDPDQNTVVPGSNILLNGSKGVILGNGTRSSDVKPNFMLTADMHQMEPEFLGGFKTPEGPEIFSSVAIPIPVLNEKILKQLMILNHKIPLPIADIRGRHLQLSETTYEKVWNNFDERPIFHEDKCIKCSSCLVEERCPTIAFTTTFDETSKQDKNLDTEKCFGCGLCKYSCLGGVFEMNTGSIAIDIDDIVHDVPIACRQSDIKRAKSLTNKLKNMIEKKEFKL